MFSYMLTNMRLPRCYIITDGCYTHVIWRCFEQRFYLQDDKIKQYIVKIWTAYKNRYGIKIYDYAIMDNHIHIVLKPTSAIELGNFMRTTSSLIARHINHQIKRKGYVLDGRYKSPIIKDEKYLLNTIAYIWLNRYQCKNKVDPRSYKYCSAYYRYHNIKNELLDSYQDFLSNAPQNHQDFVKKLLKQALAIALDKDTYENEHSIGDLSFVNSRYKSFCERMRYTEAHATAPPLIPP